MEGMRAAVPVLQPAERRTNVLRGRSTTRRLSARAPAPSLSHRGARRIVHVAASVCTPSASLPSWLVALDRAAGWAETVLRCILTRVHQPLHSKSAAMATAA